MSAAAPVTLLGLSGSLRRDSTNTALLRAAAELAPEGTEVVIHPLHDLPMFNSDVEAAGAPRAVEVFRDAVDAADGLLLASPEYNHSTTGAMKNAIDWASRGRPAPLDEKPAALLSSAGGSGGRRAQDHLRVILGHNRVQVVESGVMIVRGWQHIEDGRLTTASHRREIADALAALIVLIDLNRSSRVA